MNRLQYVQYECIKTELKEEYEKRVNFLHKRIEKRQAQQGPYQDAHLILMQNSMGELQGQNQNLKSRKDNHSPKKDFHLPGMKQKSNSIKEKKGNSKNDGL
jgi:hypothetical protein